MFTSLFQLEQKPVTVFSSNDAGAPVLTKDPGSLKTLLKACLVTGYGGKEGLGWEMQYESEDQKSAAFASTDPTASKFVFKIDNSGTTSAKLSAYQSMTDINTGVKPIAVDNIYELLISNWMLIGHSKAFILLVDIPVSSIKISYPILFGDLPRETKRMQHVCVMWSGRKGNTNSGSVQSTLFNHVNGNSLTNSTGSITWAACYPFRVANGQSGENITQSSCHFDYRSAITASVLYEPILIKLSDSTWSMLPMLQPTSNKINDVNNLGLISSEGVKSVTGYYGDAVDNGDCIVPINWWYA